MPAKAPEGLMIAELTPISRPELSKSGPPELPGLIAASIWMIPLIRRPDADETCRPKALTMPVVSV